MSTPTGFSARQLAISAEGVDARNWIEQHRAAPPHVREALGLGSHSENGLLLVRSHVPFAHFNMVLTLGCPAEVDAAAFTKIDDFFRPSRAGVHWILVNDHSEPTELGRILTQRGYVADGGWDRVVSRGQPRVEAGTGCEVVQPGTCREWSEFVVGCYSMPPVIRDWLEALAPLPNFVHAFRRRDGKPRGDIVMARSLYHDHDGWAWLGIDAPVPGVMAQCFEDDARVVATLVAEARRRGAHTFVSDVESCDPDGAGPQYEYWRRLGFEVSYRRRLFKKSTAP